ncbi:hypothetical protein HanPI659440_Chr03g0131821 [Helianthus annuus]|nr:hypothetical protein HanPI659440_Chr03g0131821 [Helianthus annuus]
MEHMTSTFTLGFSVADCLVGYRVRNLTVGFRTSTAEHPKLPEVYRYAHNWI